MLALGRPTYLVPSSCIVQKTYNEKSTVVRRQLVPSKWRSSPAKESWSWNHWAQMSCCSHAAGWMPPCVWRRTCEWPVAVTYWTTSWPATDHASHWCCCVLPDWYPLRSRCVLLHHVQQQSITSFSHWFPVARDKPVKEGDCPLYIFGCQKITTENFLLSGKNFVQKMQHLGLNDPHLRGKEHR